MIHRKKLNSVQTLYTVIESQNHELPAMITSFTVTEINSTEIVQIVYNDNADNTHRIFYNTLEPFEFTTQEKAILKWCLAYHAKFSDTPHVLMKTSSQQRLWWTCGYCSMSGIAASKNRVYTMAEQHKQECQSYVNHETETI